MNVREDIFPNLKGAEGLQNFLQGLANIAFEAFEGQFNSKDEVIQYINNFKKLEIARLFLAVAEYYHSAKIYECTNCFPPKRIDKCPFCERPLEMPANIVLIMIISIMEKLSRGLTDYIDFFNWITPQKINSAYKAMCQSGKNKNVGKMIINLKDEWRNKFGSSTRITDFFNKLAPEDKIALVKSIKFMIKVPELPPRGERFEKINPKLDYTNWLLEYQKEVKKHELDSAEKIAKYVVDNNYKMREEALPICFNEKEYWKCYHWNFSGTGIGFCCNSYSCKLKSDEKFLNDSFKEIIEVLYSWRNQFVHEAQIPPFRETAVCSGVYKKNKKSPERRIVILLTIKELKPIFERTVKKHFDKYQIHKD